MGKVVVRIVGACDLMNVGFATLSNLVVLNAILRMITLSSSEDTAAFANRATECSHIFCDRTTGALNSVHCGALSSD